MNRSSFFSGINRGRYTIKFSFSLIKRIQYIPTFLFINQQQRMQHKNIQKQKLQKKNGQFHWNSLCNFHASCWRIPQIWLRGNVFMIYIYNLVFKQQSWSKIWISFSLHLLRILFAVGVLALFAPNVLGFCTWNGICHMGSYQIEQPNKNTKSIFFFFWFLLNNVSQVFLLMLCYGLSCNL